MLAGAGMVGRVGQPNPTLRGPTLNLNFLATTLDTRISFARASSATDGVYTDASGSGYNSFSTNIPRLSAANGLLIEEARTNSLLNSDAPVTQTTASLGTGTYSLWVIGTGTATPSGGTATITGAAAASAGAPNLFTVTVAGTVTVTVGGSLTRFQLEAGAFPTSYIPTLGATATRASDVATMPVGSWFNPNACTIAAEYMIAQATNPAANQRDVVCVSDGTTNNRLLLRGQISAGSTSGVGSVASAVATITAGQLTTTANTVEKLAGAFISGTQTGCGNAGSITSAAITMPTGLTTLMLGNDNPGNNQVLNGFIRRVRYWPRALSAAELQQVTT